MNDVHLEGARQLRVLVVDDCVDIRDVFSCVIEREGHLCRTADNGQEAVEILQHQAFDMMLLDLSMPRMNGVEVASWLQAHPDVAPIMRVVAVTAWGEENMESLMEFGVASVVPKPLPLRRLKALMTETLEMLQDLELSQPVG